MNPAVAALEPSLIRKLHAAKRPGDLDLGLGQPVDTPEMAAFEAATAWVAANGCPYTPNAGDPALRVAIANTLGSSLGQMGNVVVTHGSQEAVYLSFKTVMNPSADEALIAGPAYGAYKKLCILEGLTGRMVPFGEADGFAPNAKDLLENLRPNTRLIVLASPVNPTGRVWRHHEAAALCSALLKRPGPPIYLLVDSVYESMIYIDDAANFPALYPHTLVAGSLSKSHALTGLRLGWLAGPTEVISEAVKVHQQVSTAASTFSQRVALEILSAADPFAEPRATWRRRRDRMNELLSASALEYAPLEGAFYAWIRLPPKWAGRSIEAANHLLEQSRVVVVPGVAFGAAGEGWLRLSYAGPGDVLNDAVARIVECLLH